MKKALVVMACVAILAGCVRPTDRGQQYIDGRFESILTPVPQVASESPRDFSLFNDQLAAVTANSPSLVAEHQAVYQRLQAWLDAGGKIEALADYGLEVNQMAGGDDFGNVMFTGYFSPVIEMRHQPDDLFRYPVYAKPPCDDDCPDRAAIYAGALDGQGLELGYSASLIDSFIMEVQGSGFVHFGDNDQLEYFAYGGKNGHPYVSIGKVLIERGEVPREKMSLKAIQEWVAAHSKDEVRELLEQNPSYVFFTPKAADPVSGTAGIPLKAGASVAADRRYLPMGSVLLAEVPQLDEQGNWTGEHVIKLLMALDTGGAVKENHLDLYHGMGREAGEQAGHYKHFGRVWKLDALAPQRVSQSE
ncbi:murein transglycosylase A [Salinivibrio sp. SS3]|uniref:murein transglycosylase A n=1 Tax=Salinivibrio sp. SS3 TaxID=1895021 RepID=UPI000847FC89|nr:murein transglycosylase A [Salinivibrio sp. BNH]ODP95799.1 murein transglycosylase A [Salinivibrio sp. BNH]